MTLSETRRKELKEALKDRGDMAWIAKDAGVTRQSVHAVLNGRYFNVKVVNSINKRIQLKKDVANGKIIDTEVKS